MLLQPHAQRPDTSQSILTNFCTNIYKNVKRYVQHSTTSNSFWNYALTRYGSLVVVMLQLHLCTR